MTADREWAYDVARAFLIEEQQLTSGPNGLTIEPLQRPGIAKLGGNWRIQFGSGIAGRGNAATIVGFGSGVGEARCLGAYTTTKKGLIALLRLCPGVVCRRCKGWSYDDRPLGSRWKSPQFCNVCKNWGVYGHTEWARTS